MRRSLGRLSRGRLVCEVARYKDEGGREGFTVGFRCPLSFVDILDSQNFSNLRFQPFRARPRKDQLYFVLYVFWRHGLSPELNSSRLNRRIHHIQALPNVMDLLANKGFFEAIDVVIFESRMDSDS